MDSQNQAFWAHPSAEVSPESEIGNNTKIWHNSQIMPGSKIGKNCTIGHNILVATGAVIGDSVKIQSNTDVWDGVVLQDYVFAGPSVVFTNDLNPRAGFPKNKDQYLKTLIKTGSSLGANSTIICGHEIGKYAFIGAGAVVAKDIPDYAIAVGNPAKVIGWMCECGERIFEKNESECSCKKCSRNYKKQDEKIMQI